VILDYECLVNLDDELLVNLKYTKMMIMINFLTEFFVNQNIGFKSPCLAGVMADSGC